MGSFVDPFDIQSSIAVDNLSLVDHLLVFSSSVCVRRHEDSVIALAYASPIVSGGLVQAR